MFKEVTIFYEHFAFFSYLCLNSFWRKGPICAI